MLFVDNSERVYVTDYTKHRVQRYSPVTGNFTTIAGNGTPGFLDNQLRFPFGIFVDKSDNLWVADTQNHRIMLWRSGASSGELVIGPKSPYLTADGDGLSFPFGLYIDYFGKLYVVDARNNRVQSWNLGHEPATFQCSIAAIS